MTFPPVAAPPPALRAPRIVVATVLRHEGETALFRRSRLVGSDVGLWHCITGYLEPGTTPRHQAEQEIVEELGYRGAPGLVSGPVLALPDDAGSPWRVYTFALEVDSRDVSLNWEHDDVCWIDADQCHRLPCVSWLDQVLAVVT